MDRESPATCGPHTSARLKYRLRSCHTRTAPFPRVWGKLPDASKMRSLLSSVCPSSPPRKSVSPLDGMTGKNRENSERERENASGASSTAIDLNGRRIMIPATKVSDLPAQSPSSETGTPLPDDTNVLKESVKGLKSQLRRQKQQVLPR